MCFVSDLYRLNWILRLICRIVFGCINLKKQMSLFEFKLKHPDEISPWGTPDKLSIHWFGLTDGEYYIDLGKCRLYEYTEELIESSAFATQYVDYHVSRLIEDLCEIIPSIQESIPLEFYELVKTHTGLFDFKERAYNWLDEFDSEDEMQMDQAFEQYGQHLAWIDQRMLYAGYLVAGQKIGFFRHENKIALVWESKSSEDDIVERWTATNGELEMPYQTFVEAIKDFADRFTEAMDRQIELAVAKDWQNVFLDKEALLKEHENRKQTLSQRIAILTTDQKTVETDWKSNRIF